MLETVIPAWTTFPCSMRYMSFRAHEARLGLGGGVGSLSFTIAIT